MTEEELWCLWTWESDTDYVLCEWDIDILPKLYKQDDIRFEYNQAEQDRSHKSCTVFWAIGMASDLMNYEFSLDEINEIDELSYQNGRQRWSWRYTKSAVHLVYQWRNSNEELVSKYGRLAYYRINKYSSLVDEILWMWYTLETNLCPTSSYSADYRKDAVLDWCDFWKETNWHAIDIIRNEWHRSTKDSYKWRKTYDWKKDCNRYELKHHLAELTNYSTRLYLYTKVKEDNLERIKELNTIKSEILVSTESASRLRHLTKSEEYQRRLHNENERKRNERLDYINNELKSLA